MTVVCMELTINRISFSSVSVSHHLVNGIARAGNGFSEFIRDSKDVSKVVRSSFLPFCCLLVLLMIIFDIFFFLLCAIGHASVA